MYLKGKSAGVIGGGIGGLSAALALARRGADVTVFEQAMALGEVGAGVQISTNGVRVMQALGLDPLAGNAGNMPTSVELRDGISGGAIVTLPLNRSPANPFIQYHRADLLNLLATGCDKAGVVVQLGKSASVANCETGQILCTDGSDPVEFDVVIAADGVRSTSRQTYFAGESPPFAGQVAWRALVPADAVPEFADQTGTRLYLGPKRHLVVYPLRDRGLINIVAVEERDTWAAEGWNHHDDPENLRRAFRNWCPYVIGLLQRIDAPLLWGLFEHPVLPRWSRGKAALLGDAAHPMLPFMAQGACMALEDAWVLAAMLDQHGDTYKALKVYEKYRKPRATRVQAVSHRNARIYHAAHPLVRRPLHLGMTLAAKVASGLLTRRYNWIYDLDVTKV